MLIENYSKFTGDLSLTILIIGVVQGLVSFSIFPLASAAVVGNNPPKNSNAIIAAAGINNIPRNAPQPQSIDTNSKVSATAPNLAEAAACKDYISRHCEQSSLNNNFEVLECVQNVKRVNVLNNQCQNIIWSFKHEITKDERFEATAKQLCAKLLIQHPECHAKKGEEGQLLYCLMEFTDNSTEETCQSFLRKMEAIVFSDYRLIYKFTTSCQRDISNFQCGRLNSDHDNAPHSQGKTIECLSKKTEKLEPNCRHEILRIAELQSDDFHLDRPLFFACRDDREKFCSRVMAGEGRVYRCLMRHKSDREISSECRDKLFQREKLVVQDYKVNRGLAKACREDIKMYHCRDETSERREFRLAQILLCLENAIRKGYPVEGECQAEMKDHRKALMENYKFTPDLASACEQDIVNFCKHLEGGGKTIHCLMAHARPSRKTGNRISDKCRREVEFLLKEVDIGESWKVDPLFQEACEPVVNSICSDVSPGQGRILSCLMDHVDSSPMRESCKEILLQIQYFVARDFKLDFMLYKACKPDAELHCHAKKEWHDKPSKMDPERGPIVLPCLYRYAYHPDQNVRLSKECLYELKRVMRQRAMSVDLQPEIEEPCLADLSRLCSDNVEKGQELTCLQLKLKDLKSKDCFNAISNYTEEEAEHLELNYPLYRACDSILNLFCKEMRSKDVDQGDLIQCLITHKNTPEMKNTQKCRVAVEHFQLITLKDYRFTFKFKEACKKDVLAFCKLVKTKSDVVSCLSGIVTNDTLSNRRNRISRECRGQLRAELLQRSENILLDPTLDKACKDDQKKFCPDTNVGESQMQECLKDHQKQLSPDCHKILFNREKVEMIDNAVDSYLMHHCKASIKRFCSDVELSQVLYCLKDNKMNTAMEPICRKLVIKRLIEQNLDYRLNPRLKKACIDDIPKFCSKIIDREAQDELFEGKVIACLKKEYRKNRLSQMCDIEVMSVMRDSGWDIQLDAVLVKACSEEIHEKCRDEGDKEECLKMKFQEKAISNEPCRKELARYIFEGKADIHSDPLLYRVCIQDLKHYCSDVPAGHGKQLSCLLATVESGSATLTVECKTTLSKRMEMFEYAAQVSPAESVEELIRQVADSPARNYFIVVALAFFGIIFIGGLFCGRISRHVPSSTKNK